MEVILDGDNRGVVSNLQRYLPILLKEDNNLDHIFTYDNRNIIEYTTAVLTEDDTKKQYAKHLVSQ